MGKETISGEVDCGSLSLMSGGDTCSILFYHFCFGCRSILCDYNKRKDVNGNDAWLDGNRVLRPWVVFNTQN